MAALITIWDGTMSLPAGSSLPLRPTARPRCLVPGWPQAFFCLGKAYRELSRYQEAATALKRAVLLKSDYARAYHFLGLVLIDLGRYEEAAAALVKAYTFNPGWAETYYDNTTFGIHHELGMDKAVNLRLIKYIYPVNQHLARILYNNWSRATPP